MTKKTAIARLRIKKGKARAKKRKEELQMLREKQELLEDFVKKT